MQVRRRNIPTASKVERTESAKVWWPNESVSAESGYLVGWNTRGFSCLVAAVVQNQSLEDIEHGLDDVAQDSALDDVRQHCRGDLMVLGEWSNSRRGASSESENAERRARRRSADLWLKMSLSRSERLPVLREVYCCGVTYRPSYNVVMFSCPRPGHPLMTKISFPRILPHKSVRRRQTLSGATADSVRSSDGKNKGKTDSDGDANLETEIKVRQVNACMQMSGRLFTALARESGQKLVSGHQIDGASPSSGERNAVTSAVQPTTTGATQSAGRGGEGGFWTQIAGEHTSKPRACAYLALLGMRHTCELLLPLLERPLPLPIGEARQAALAHRWRSDGHGGGEKLKLRLIDISATANQLNFKMRQFCLLPIRSNVLFGLSAARPVELHDLTMRHTHALGMLNSAYVGVVDMFLGTCFILLLFYQEAHLMQTLEGMLEMSRCVYIDFLREYVDWLIDEPAGFKLNKNLNRFLGALYVDSIDVWSDAYMFVVPTGRIVLKLLSLCGVGGLSCLVALAADVLSVSTLHICLFYNSMGTAYETMLRVLHSLALLFQGQKWNTLRSRADTCEFELDQLLLGTLLFAIHFFLFPNIFGFYIFFVVIWAQVVLLQLSVAILLILVNNFPIYPILLLLTEPGRVCGGISFAVLSKPSAATTSPRSQLGSSAGPGGDPEFSRPRAGSAGSSTNRGAEDDQIAPSSTEPDGGVVGSMRFRGMARELRGRERLGVGVGVGGRGGAGNGGSGSPRLLSERVAVHLELSSHPASVGEICAECGSCVVAVLAPYAPQHIVRSVFHGKHLACPPFVQVWTTTSDWPTLPEFIEFLDISFQTRRHSVRKTTSPKSAPNAQAQSVVAEPEPAPTPTPAGVGNKPMETPNVAAAQEEEEEAPAASAAEELAAEAPVGSDTEEGKEVVEPQPQPEPAGADTH